MRLYPHIQLTTSDADPARDIPQPRGGKRPRGPDDRLQHAEQLAAQRREVFGDVAGEEPEEEEPFALVLELRPGYSARTKPVRDALHRLGLEPGHIDAEQRLTAWTTPTTRRTFAERLDTYTRTKGREGPTFNPIQRVRRRDVDERIAPCLKEIVGLDGTQPLPVLLRLDSSAPQSVAAAAVEAVLQIDPTAHYTQADGVGILQAHLTAERIRSLLEARSAIALAESCPDYTPVLRGQSAGAVEHRPLVLPGNDAPSVCMLDTGVDSHPYLAGVVTVREHAPYLPNGLDEGGHGTFVAGLIAYGDEARTALRRQVLQPSHQIISVRVFGPQGPAPGPDQLLEEIRGAVLRHRSRTRVFNLSLQSNTPYRLTAESASLPTALAVGLDRLAREQDVLFVVAAGNVGSSQLEYCDQDFPYSHRSPACAIHSPAEAVNTLSVGACYRDVEPEGLLGEPGGPSPCTTAGPGIDDMMKPEVVGVGGGYALAGHRIRSTPETSVFSLGLHAAGGFHTDVGTSYAAALVSRLAASLQERYPGSTANLLKALVIHATEPVGPIITSPDADGLWRTLSGFGRPNEEVALASRSSRVFYLFQGTLGVGKRQDVRFFVPAIFQHCALVAPKQALRATLVYDPPVNPETARYYTKLDVALSLHAPTRRGNEPIALADQRGGEGHNVKYRCYEVRGKCRAGAPWVARLACKSRGGAPLAPDEQQQRYALVIELRDMTGRLPLYDQCVSHYVKQDALKQSA